jgi:hypothetical protein
MRSASISLISNRSVDKLSAEILQAIVMLNKRGFPPMIKTLVDATSATSRAAVQNRLALLEQYGYINRKRLGKFAQIVVLKTAPKVLTCVDLGSGRKPNAKQLRKKEIKDYRKSREAECFEKAVKLGLSRVSAVTEPLHDSHSLFWNRRLTACKIG